MSWAPGCKWWLPLDADRVRQVAWCEAERPFLLLFPVLHWRGSDGAGVLHPGPPIRESRPGLSGRGEHRMLTWSVVCMRGRERFIELSRKLSRPRGREATCSTNQRGKKGVKNQVSALPHCSSQLSNQSLRVLVSSTYRHN